jgi:hypothetical protein
MKFNIKLFASVLVLLIGESNVWARGKSHAADVASMVFCNDQKRGIGLAQEKETRREDLFGGCCIISKDEFVTRRDKTPISVFLKDLSVGGINVHGNSSVRRNNDEYLKTAMAERRVIIATYEIPAGGGDFAVRLFNPDYSSEMEKILLQLENGRLEEILNVDTVAGRL